MTLFDHRIHVTKKNLADTTSTRFTLNTITKSKLL